MSFNIALAGINAINGQLNQISNNIANSGTLGFKSGRANFASSYINAMPSGVSIGSTSQSMDVTGNFSATGRGLDAAIAGKGFFISRDTDGSMVYSRAGVFNIDKNGNVTDFMSRVVQGYGADGALGSLTIPTGSIPAQASSSLEYVGNMSADWTKPTVSPFNKDDPKSYNGISAATVTDSLRSSIRLLVDTELRAGTRALVRGRVGVAAPRRSARRRPCHPRHEPFGPLTRGLTPVSLRPWG